MIPRCLHVNRGQSHLRWSKTVPPVLTVDSGDTVSFDCEDASSGQITPASTVEAVVKFDIALADPVFGPVHVRGAEPGDALEVEILDLRTADWGWTAIVPGFGLLADEFAEPQLKLWELPIGEGLSYATFRRGIKVPLRPFLGQMGVAPGEDGDFSTIPPRDTGGNVDCRHLTVGTRVFLPVRTPGALFSCGDGHAAQGDGEVCGSAIETPMRATLRLTVRKGHDWISSPHYLCPEPRPDSAPPDHGCYAVLGIDPDLREAARKAVRGIVAYLVRTRHLTREEAYMFSSVAVDLKLAEVVDMPNYAVSASLPLNVFTEAASRL